MAYSELKLSNSQLTNKRAVDHGDDLVRSALYLQRKQDEVLNDKDLIDTSLEDVLTTNEDKDALNVFKDSIKSSLSSITDSKYVGDYDRQVNKVVAKSKKGVAEIEGNYKAQQEYIKEAKKAGLSDDDVQRHLALSKSTGGLKYDKNSGQFNNRFNGYSIAEPVDQKTVREAVATMKPSVYKYDDGVNTIEKTTFNVLSPDEAAQIIAKQGNKLTANDKRMLMASVENHQNLEAYYKTSPEFDKRRQFESDYAILQAKKLKAPNDVKLAYAQKLANDADDDGLKQVVDFAKLRTQNDEKSEWSERGKFNATTNREIMMESLKDKHDKQNIYLRSALDEAKDIRKENREGQGTLNLNDLSAVRGNPNVERNDDGTLKNQPVEEKGFLANTFNNLVADFKSAINGTSKESERAKIDKYNISTLADNLLVRDSPIYKKNKDIIESKTSTATQKEQAEKQNQQIAVQNKDNIAREVAGNTSYQVPITKRIGKKANEADQVLLEQTIGNDLNGWARSYKAREIGADGSVSAVTDFGTLLEDSGIDKNSKEFKKAIKGDSDIVNLDGYIGSDGELGRGLQVTIKNPDNGETKTYALELPLKERAYKGKNSVLTEKEAIRAKREYIHKSGDKEIHAYNKAGGTHYKVYDKTGKLVDTYNIDSQGNQLK